ncbi:MAG: PTS sugar transporter subunit IIA [Sedimentisphaerales bacterium]|nr:PTS sugar transporter subunit IIA [Sedimentisphaerales bacterium]
MQLIDILELSCVKVPLEAADKPQAIIELVKLLNQNGKINDYQIACQAVIDREAVRSTGVGQGFAIPHGKTPAVDNIVMAVGKLKDPIDFDSIDSQPVSIIVLLVSPVHQTGPHIQALARISRIMTSSQARQKLHDCTTPEELYKIIADHENPNDS